MSRTFLITGATGQQGGHTARILLTAGHNVHALVRDPSSPAATHLLSLGARVFEGDFSTPASILAAAEGCSGAFVNVSPTLSSRDGERIHAANIFAACLAAGVTKIVQSSVAAVGPHDDDDSATPTNAWMKGYLASKRACEDAVTSAPGLVSWTILRPARLLSTYVAPLAGWMFPDLVGRGVIRTALGRATRQQVLDPMDLGRFAARALVDDDTGAFHHAVITLATEEMTMGDIAAAMNKAIGDGYGGRKVEIEYLSEEEVEATKDANPIVASELFLNERTAMPDLAMAKSYGIERVSVAGFFEREREALLRAVGL